MTAYRRVRVGGGSYFFTVNLADRNSCTLTENISLLRQATTVVRTELPFAINAMVILPEHLHAVWTLPPGDADFSTRWKKIKTLFTKSVGGRWPCSASKRAKGERGLWQRRFWEHTIRDQQDMNLHMQYCWINPVKHNLVRRVADWPYSSFHREVRRGVVPEDWARTIIDGDFGE